MESGGTTDQQGTAVERTRDGRIKRGDRVESGGTTDQQDTAVGRRAHGADRHPTSTRSGSTKIEWRQADPPEWSECSQDPDRVF